MNSSLVNEFLYLILIIPSVRFKEKPSGKSLVDGYTSISFTVKSVSTQSYDT